MAAVHNDPFLDTTTIWPHVPTNGCCTKPRLPLTA